MGKNLPGNPETGYTETHLFHDTPQRVTGPQQSLRVSLRMASLRIQGWNPHHTWINSCAQQCLNLFVIMHQEWETLPGPNLLLGWEHWNSLTRSGVGKIALLGTLASKQDSNTALHSASAGTTPAQRMGSDWTHLSPSCPSCPHLSLADFSPSSPVFGKTVHFNYSHYPITPHNCIEPLCFHSKVKHPHSPHPSGAVLIYASSGAEPLMLTQRSQQPTNHPTTNVVLATDTLLFLCS